MPKNTQQFFTCSNCDAQFTKWAGKCLARKIRLAHHGLSDVWDARPN